MSEKRKSLEKNREQNQDVFKELDAETATMLEDKEIRAIAGQGEEWWCPNPECGIVDK